MPGTWVLGWQRSLDRLKTRYGSRALEPAMHIYARPLSEYLLLSDRVYLVHLSTKLLGVIKGTVDSRPCK